ncbi:MAG TPA: hypothetical protein VF717_07200, partial [Pyrinomonadaceae bacterium]
MPGLVKLLQRFHLRIPSETAAKLGQSAKNSFFSTQYLTWYFWVNRLFLILAMASTGKQLQAAGHTGEGSKITLPETILHNKGFLF